MARWLITGCSTGFGREIARAVLEAGHSAVVTARRSEAVQDFADEFGDRAAAVALDVTDADQIADAVSAAENAFGGVDVLVNNAGHGYLSAVEEGEDAEVRKLFDVNYFGAVNMIKAVLPAMRARRSGHIVNISSMTGWWPTRPTRITRRPSSRSKRSPKRWPPRSGRWASRSRPSSRAHFAPIGRPAR